MISTSHMAVAREFLALHPPPGRLLLCAVTGSHIYGFPSPDSDIDLKGLHLAPTEQLLGLRAPAVNHDRLEVFQGVECDLTTHEAGRAMAWLLKGNGNILERIFSPLQVCRGAEADRRLKELRALAGGALSRRCHGHYAGYFKGMQRECRAQGDAPRAKTLLYSYRVALTGIHLLRSGEVQPHLPTLAERYGYPEAAELIAIKREGQERSALNAAAAERFRALWPRLEVELAEARDTSPLPEEPANTRAVEDWLVRARRAALDSASGATS
jgi:uncharacterized protein